MQLRWSESASCHDLIQSNSCCISIGWDCILSFEPAYQQTSSYGGRVVLPCFNGCNSCKAGAASDSVVAGTGLQDLTVQIFHGKKPAGHVRLRIQACFNCIANCLSRRCCCVQMRPLQAPHKPRMAGGLELLPVKFVFQ